MNGVDPDAWYQREKETIEVGKPPDLILIRCNPLQDVTNLQNILGVMATGRWYPKETLDEMLMLAE